jgi:hypothetical protein
MPRCKQLRRNPNPTQTCEKLLQPLCQSEKTNCHARSFQLVVSGCFAQHSREIPSAAASRSNEAFNAYAKEWVEIRRSSCRVTQLNDASEIRSQTRREDHLCRGAATNYARATHQSLRSLIIIALFAFEAILENELMVYSFINNENQSTRHRHSFEKARKFGKDTSGNLINIPRFVNLVTHSAYIME